MADQGEGVRVGVGGLGAAKDLAGLRTSHTQLAAAVLQDLEPAVGIDELEEGKAQLEAAVFFEVVPLIGQQRIERLHAVCRQPVGLAPRRRPQRSDPSSFLEPPQRRVQSTEGDPDEAQIPQRSLQVIPVAGPATEQTEHRKIQHGCEYIETI